MYFTSRLFFRSEKYTLYYENFKLLSSRTLTMVINFCPLPFEEFHKVTSLVHWWMEWKCTYYSIKWKYSKQGMRQRKVKYFCSCLFTEGLVATCNILLVKKAMGSIYLWYRSFLVKLQLYQKGTPIHRAYSRDWGHGCVFWGKFFKKRAFCLLAPPKQM